MKDPNKISPGNPPRKSYLSWLIFSGMFVLAGVVFVVSEPARKPAPPGALSENPSSRPSPERTPPFSRPTESRSSRTQTTKVTVNPDNTITTEETDPILQKIDLAFSAGKCNELTKIAGSSVNADGTRQFYASSLYSSGVSYWKQKDFQKAANYMRCFLNYYRDYRDEVLLVLTDSEIALGDKARARQHLQELKKYFPNRKSEIQNLERKLVLSN